jgi:hypothetical protein
MAYIAIIYLAMGALILVRHDLLLIAKGFIVYGAFVPLGLRLNCNGLFRLGQAIPCPGPFSLVFRFLVTFSPERTLTWIDLPSR